jgi:hypothetical protein
MCSCYKNGKIKEPPHKELLQFDDEGPYIDIYTNITQKEREEKYYKMEEEFNEWKRTACEHEDMELAHEYLANVMGMADFKYIVEVLGGEDKYPILSKFLPSSNDGILPAEYAQIALMELNDLENIKNSFEEILLVETMTNELKTSVNTNTYKHFAFTEYNKNIYGIDIDGFYILEKKDNSDDYYLVFRSKEFVQNKISEKMYEFIELKDSYNYKGSLKLHPFEGEATNNYQFKTIIQKYNISEEYNYIIEPLKNLAKASIESGNPICWL